MRCLNMSHVNMSQNVSINETSSFKSGKTYRTHFYSLLYRDGLLAECFVYICQIEWDCHPRISFASSRNGNDDDHN